MKQIKEKIVAEIGNNHLGNLKYFRKYVDAIIDLKLKNATIQIREREFYKINNNNKYLLSSKNIENQFNRLRKRNIKTGLAVADINFTEITNNYKVDFFKILSWKADDFKLIDYLMNFNKTIYISLGTLSARKIKNLSNNLEGYKNIKFIHTQLNYDIDDLNLLFLKKLKNHSKIPVSYGHHSRNNLDPLIMSLALEIDKIFIYLKLNSKNKFPDHEHAINIDLLPSLLEELQICLRLLGKEKKIMSKNMIEKLANRRKI